MAGKLLKKVRKEESIKYKEGCWKNVISWQPSLCFIDDSYFAVDVLKYKKMI